jgi:hypothetical protein
MVENRQCWQTMDEVLKADTDYQTHQKQDDTAKEQSSHSLDIMHDKDLEDRVLSIVLAEHSSIS